MSTTFFDESPYTEQDAELTEWPRITSPQSTTSSVFVSHTSLDRPVCEKWILPTIEWVVSDPIFLDYKSFNNPFLRDAYAQQVIVYLRCSEHLVVVLSKNTLSSMWVHEEVSSWLNRRRLNDITVFAVDDSKPEQLHPDLASAALINFSQSRWPAIWLFSRRLKAAMASSGWLIVKRWPRRAYRSMLPR